MPLNIQLDNERRILVISGPNAGGKSVCLTTVGLLQYMLQCGLLIPVKDDSMAGIFQNLFIDIGDEQSLAASLSTFSAHLENIKGALDEAGDDCLVLLDEIGAGTDPDEGAALGQAIIERLTERGIPSVVTTHHGRLKALAVDNPLIRNGSLDFDSVTMTPTYKFRTGIPGLSYAIETARRIGLEKAVTDRAESLLDASERKLAGIITALSDKLKAAENSLAETENRKLSYEALAGIYKNKLDNLEQEKKQLKKESLEKAAQIARELKNEIAGLIEQAKQSEKKLESLRSIKRHIQEKSRSIEKQIEKLSPAPQLAAAEGRVGENVYLPDLKKQGLIIERPDQRGRVKVRIGAVVLHTELRRLYKAADTEAGRKELAGAAAYFQPEPDLEVDLRGLTFDEAEPVLEKYLEDVYFAHFNNVTIIHGKGTGALRVKVHDYLKRNPRVSSFRLGNWNEGSYGVTIVEIKKD